MKENQNNLFLLFPLPAIRGFIGSPDKILEIYYFGMAGYAIHRKGESTLRSACRQLLFLHFRKPDKLKNTDVESMPSKYATIQCYADNHCPEIMDSGGINDALLDEFIDEMERCYSRHHDTILHWYMAYHALDNNNITQAPNRRVCNALDEWERMAKDQPLVAVNARFMYDVCNDSKPSTDEDTAVVAMYFGMLSLIGMKAYCSSTKEALLRRMFGIKSEAELCRLMKDKDFKAHYDKYYPVFSSRRRYEKLRRLVAQRYGVISVGSGRKLLLSYLYDNEQELLEAVGNKGGGKVPKHILPVLPKRDEPGPF